MREIRQNHTPEIVKKDVIFGVLSLTLSTACMIAGVLEQNPSAQAIELMMGLGFGSMGYVCLTLHRNKKTN